MRTILLVLSLIAFACGASNVHANSLVKRTDDGNIVFAFAGHQFKVFPREQDHSNVILYSGAVRMVNREYRRSMPPDMHPEPVFSIWNASNIEKEPERFADELSKAQRLNVSLSNQEIDLPTVEARLNGIEPTEGDTAWWRRFQRGYRIYVEVATSPEQMPDRLGAKHWLEASATAQGAAQALSEGARALHVRTFGGVRVYNHLRETSDKRFFQDSWNWIAADSRKFKTPRDAVISCDLQTTCTRWTRSTDGRMEVQVRFSNLWERAGWVNADDFFREQIRNTIVSSLPDGIE
jgi:hypothetical protein